MVLVDTSVWIALFRQKSHPLGEFVSLLVARNEACVCGQIFVEFIGGFRKLQLRHSFSKSFKQFPFLPTSKEAYEMAADLLAELPRLGSGDAIIAATAMIAETDLLTLDKDFQTVQKKGLKLVEF